MGHGSLGWQPLKTWRARQKCEGHSESEFPRRLGSVQEDPGVHNPAMGAVDWVAGSQIRTLGNEIFVPSWAVRANRPLPHLAKPGPPGRNLEHLAGPCPTCQAWFLVLPPSEASYPFRQQVQQCPGVSNPTWAIISTTVADIAGAFQCGKALENSKSLARKEFKELSNRGRRFSNTPHQVHVADAHAQQIGGPSLGHTSLEIVPPTGKGTVAV